MTIVFLTSCVALLAVGLWQAMVVYGKLTEIPNITALIGFKYTLLVLEEAAGIYMSGLTIKSSALYTIGQFDFYNKNVNTQLQFADTEATIQLALDLFLMVFESFSVLTLVLVVIVQATYSLTQFVEGEDKAALETVTP